MSLVYVFVVSFPPHMWTAPSAAPHQLEAIVVSSNQIQVQWEQLPKSARNGIVTHYTVYYQPKVVGSKLGEITTDGDQPQTDVVAANMTSLLLGDLIPYTTYDVSVSASTDVGEGPLSDAVSVATDESSKLFSNEYSDNSLIFLLKKIQIFSLPFEQIIKFWAMWSNNPCITV